MKRLLCYYILFSLPLCLFSNQPFAGIWENSERFLAFTADENSHEGTLRVVLKTYYRYVYENMGTYPFTLNDSQHTAGTYTVHLRYPDAKQESEVSFGQLGDMLFSSFYTREAIPVQNANIIEETNSDVQSTPAAGNPMQELHGFWLEQGQRYGIFLYPQNSPDFFDAFFFDGNGYIKFRYWKDDLEYRPQYAGFQLNGKDIKVPKLIIRNADVYSCITSNGSVLRNYERGSWQIEEENGTAYITLTPEGGGPGSHAVGDTYPHHSYPHFNRIPLHYDAKNGVFAFGLPFVSRSSVQDLSEEIKKHNSLQRPPPEPLLQADQLDFRWERIKELRKYQ